MLPSLSLMVHRYIALGLWVLSACSVACCVVGLIAILKGQLASMLQPWECWLPLWFNLQNIFPVLWVLPLHNRFHGCVSARPMDHICWIRDWVNHTGNCCTFHCTSWLCCMRISLCDSCAYKQISLYHGLSWILNLLLSCFPSFRYLVGFVLKGQIALMLHSCFKWLAYIFYCSMNQKQLHPR